MQPIGRQRRWREVVERAQFNAQLRQLRDPVPGDNIGMALTEALHQAIERELDREQRPAHHFVNFAITAHGFTHAYQTANFTVGEFLQRTARLAEMLATLAGKLNSNEAFNPYRGFQVDVVFVSMPGPGSRRRKQHNPGRLEQEKKCIIPIRNRDTLCCARAIVTMRAHCHKDQGVDGFRDLENLKRGCPVQQRQAQALHQQAGVAEGPCDYVRGTRPMEYCSLCHRKFYGGYCKRHHEVSKQCQSIKTCLKCQAQYTVVPNRRHQCGNAKCPVCQAWVPIQDHKCYIQPTVEDEEPEPTEEGGGCMVAPPPPLFVYADFEAMQNVEGVFVADLLCYSSSEETTIHLLDGEDCALQFLRELDDPVRVPDSAEDREIRVVFHNLKGFDGMFILHELYQQQLEHHLTPDTIAVEPLGGWRGAQVNQSLKALQWLYYQEHLLPKQGACADRIRHLTFPLRRACVQAEQAQPMLIRTHYCPHSDADRMLRGTWCTPELVKAVEKGYTLVKIHEVWHFPPEQRQTGLFATYVNTWLKIKQESAGWPSWCQTLEKKREYILRYQEREGIRLDIASIAKNPGRKATAKLMLNSFWGKFGERINKPTTVTVQNPAYLFRLISDAALDISTLRLCTDDILEAVYTSVQGNAVKGTKTNIFMAAFTTCHARLKLYESLDTLQQQVLYYDTDSVIYRWRPGQPSITTGDFLGDMTDELDGDVITEFVSGGAKNYGYTTRQGNVVCKVRGFTLNVRGSAILNFHTMKDNILSELDSPQDSRRNLNIVTPYYFQRDLEKKQIQVVPRVKQYGLVFDKRVINVTTRSSYPYGYERIGNELDLLLDL
ncbi:unnamed protein product [Porites evermanni]|uniref:DNA-directed DNA polymerase n=1 Tax=Porites evermanni TaxID=104178 RepID=A0ABN8PHT7_9CNID|nr:unnamed protein product [Porites evermanni]